MEDKIKSFRNELNVGIKDIANIIYNNYDERKNIQTDYLNELEKAHFYLSCAIKTINVMKENEEHEKEREELFKKLKEENK